MLCEHSSRIDELTVAITNLKYTQLAQLLYARAQAHVEMGDLDSALADAHELLKTLPNSPLGYLCVGQVYEAKCRLSEALWYYTACPVAAHPPVAETTMFGDKYSKELEIHAEQARAQLNRKVDWVKLIPADVIALILAELSIMDCWVLSKVCRQWSTIIPNCMYLATRNMRIMPANRQKMIQFIDTRAQSLTFEKCAPTPHIDSCQNLRKLVLYECAIYDNTELLASLKPIGSGTLCDLTMTIHPRCPPIKPEALLEVCPNLTHLTYHAPHYIVRRDIPSADSGLVSTSPLKIQHLSWDIDARWRPLEKWLCRMPELKTLRIPYRPFDSGRQSIDLPVLLRHSPNLTHLDFHSTFRHCPAPWIAVSSPDQQGLIEFHMGGLSEYTGAEIVPLILLHPKTLRVLRIAVDATDSHQIDGWDIPANLNLPVLRMLHLANLNIQNRHISSLIRRSPVLTDIVLKHLGSIQDSFLQDTLCQCEHLSRLAIVVCANLTSNGINQLFLNAKGRLRHVILNSRTQLAVQTIYSLAVAHGETLEHVELNSPLSRAGDAGLLSFVEKLRPYGMLRHFEVWCSGDLTPDTVHALADHPRLTSVSFVECPRLTDDAIRLLVDKSTSLKTIQVAHCRAISYLGLHYARGVLGRDAVRDIL